VIREWIWALLKVQVLFVLCFLLTEYVLCSPIALSNCTEKKTPKAQASHLWYVSMLSPSVSAIELLFTSLSLSNFSNSHSGPVWMSGSDNGKCWWACPNLPPKCYFLVPINCLFGFSLCACQFVVICHIVFLSCKKWIMWYIILHQFKFVGCNGICNIVLVCWVLMLLKASYTSWYNLPLRCILVVVLFNVYSIIFPGVSLDRNPATVVLSLLSKLSWNDSTTGSHAFANVATIVLLLCQDFLE
jgi:hypothetical protein